MDASASEDQTDPTSATGVTYFEKICISKFMATRKIIIIIVNKAVAMKGLTLSLLHLPFAFAFCILHFEFKFPAKIWIA